MNCILEFNLRSKETELVISEYLRQYSETIATWLNITLFDLQSALYNGRQLKKVTSILANLLNLLISSGSCALFMLNKI